MKLNFQVNLVVNILDEKENNQFYSNKSASTLNQNRRRIMRNNRMPV